MVCVALGKALTVHCSIWKGVYLLRAKCASRREAVCSQHCHMQEYETTCGCSVISHPAQGDQYVHRLMNLHDIVSLAFCTQHEYSCDYHRSKWAQSAACVVVEGRSSCSPFSCCWAGNYKQSI